MVSLAIPAWNIILRSVIVYFFLLFGLRLSGKREIGQMTIFDLVLLLLIANAVQNAMVGPDSSVLGGVIAALTLLIVNRGVAHLRLRWPRLRYLIEGSPTILVLHGELITEHLRREGLDQEALETALREHGVATIKEVEMAILEVDGTISVIPTDKHTKRIKHHKKKL